MSKDDNTVRRQGKSGHDSTKLFTDSTGVRWRITAEFKTFNERLDVSSLAIHPDDARTPITRRLLNEIPLDKLFREDLAIESQHISRMLKARRGTTAHPGRAHHDFELRAVAEIYRAAYQARMPVQKSVADALGVSVSTAAKRIMAARQRGFIRLLHEED